MKVEVRNLGVIKEAKLDLKPLTIFVGPNNAGKTWLAYTFAGIMGTAGKSRYTTAYIHDEVQDAYPSLDSAVQQVLEKGNAKIDLVQFAEEYEEIYINNVARFARQWMRQYMGTVMAFDSLEFHLNLATIKEDLSRKVLNSVHDSKLSFNQRRRSPLLSVLKEKGKRELFIYSSSEENIEDELPRRAVKESLVTSVFQSLHTAFYPNTYILPVERSAYIALGSFNQLQKFTTDPKFLSLVEHFVETQWREKAIGPVSAPLGMFLETMSTMFDTSTMFDREDAAKRNPEIKKYIQLAKLLEECVLGGSVDFSN